MESNINYKKLSELLTEKQKNEKEKEYFRHKLEQLLSKNRNKEWLDYSESGELSRVEKKRRNFMMYHNKLIPQDYENDLSNPYLTEDGSMKTVAPIKNRDIVSPKIKSLVNNEDTRLFNYRAISQNKNTSSRKQEVRIEKIKGYVLEEIQSLVNFEAEKKFREQSGKGMSKAQENQLRQEIEQEKQKITPDKLEKYMSRDHLEAVEEMANQLIAYFIKKQDLVNKFRKGCTYSAIVGEEVYLVSDVNGELNVELLNSIRDMGYNKKDDSNLIQDFEWFWAETYMDKTEILSKFNLTNSEIKKLSKLETPTTNEMFSEEAYNHDVGNKICVVRCAWKDFRKFGLLKRPGQETIVVTEDYELREDNQETLEWKWGIEVYEAVKVGDFYPEEMMRVVPGNKPSANNLYKRDLPFIGAVLDADLGYPVSPLDRMYDIQKDYNVTIRTLRALMASDKGKKLMMNIGAIPTSANIDLNQWMYFLEQNNIAFFNPNEEGNRGVAGDAGSVAKEINLSLANDIQKYIEIGEYLDRKAGEVIGVSKAMEGSIKKGEAVSNVQQEIQQNTYILESFYSLHAIVKRNVLRRIIELAPYIYRGNKASQKLSYVLDDLSIKILEVDYDLIRENNINVFVDNTPNTAKIMQMIEQYSHASIQTGKAVVSDIIKAMQATNLRQAQEIMEESERKQSQELHQQNMELEQVKQSGLEKQHDLMMEIKEKDHQNNLEAIRLKAELDYRRDIDKQTILALGFNEDKDMDKDGMPDVLEVQKFGVDAEVKMSKAQLEREKFEHDKIVHQDNKKKNEEEIKIKKRQLAKKAI